MKNNQKNQKTNYSIEKHAFELFDSNSKFLKINNEEFDILPFSETYYSNNIECFPENDGLEILSFIRILKEKGFIEQTGQLNNIVRLTENGIKRISFIKECAARNPYSGV